MIDLAPRHLETVRRILKEHVPGCEVRAFGSRVDWTAKDYSDLDLAVMDSGTLKPDVLGRLKEAFEESDLPVRVDVLDWHATSLSFQKVIEKQYEVVQTAQSSGATRGWCETTVGVIASAARNALVGGPFGSNLVSADYADGGIPVIRGQNMGERWVRGEFAYVTAKKAESLEANLARPGDIIFTQRGTLGQVSIVPDGPFNRYLISQSQMKLTVDRTKGHPLFFYYVFRTSEQKEYIRQHAIQTGVPHTNLGILRDTPVPVPPLEEQRAIAHILGTLDDKIELNRRMNETLEAMARAIFESWFVDFDPVRAKMEGRQPAGMDAETAALFLDSFEDSALGKIPKGWKVDEIKARASRIQYGLTQSASEEPIGPRFLRITDIQTGRIDWRRVPYCKGSEEDYEKYRVVPGDIFVARTGASTGENVYVTQVPEAVFASYLVRFQFAHPSIARIVGEYMRTDSYFERVAGALGGSAQPNASAQVLAGATLVFPPLPIAERFAKLVEPMDQLRAENETHSGTLATIRDALLPRLISGEIRVKG